MANRPYQDKSWLRSRWFSEATIEDIADEAGCSPATIRRWRKGHDLPPRRETATEDKPYRDREWLAEQWASEKSAEEIADGVGCDSSILFEWAKRFGLTGMRELRREWWQDEDVLRQLYWDEGLSQRQIEHRLGVSRRSVQYWMDRLDIERRSRSVANQLAIAGTGVRTDRRGYERVRTHVMGEPVEFPLHRLVAVAEYGFDAIRDKEIHHKNGIPWDNRPNNLEPLTKSEHAELHNDVRRRQKRANRGASSAWNGRGGP